MQVTMLRKILCYKMSVNAVVVAFFNFILKEEHRTALRVSADGQLAYRQNNTVLIGVSDEAVLNTWFAL